MKLMKNKKRIAVGTLSTVAIVALPIAMVISCGEVSKLKTKVKDLRRDIDLDLEIDTISEYSSSVASMVEAILLGRNSLELRRLGNIDGRKFIHNMGLETISKMRAKESSRLANAIQGSKVEFDITKWATEYEKYFLKAMEERVVTKSITFHWKNSVPFKFEVGNGSELSVILNKLKETNLSIIDEMEGSEYKDYLKKYRKAQLKGNNLELWRLDNEEYYKMYVRIDDIRIASNKLANKATEIINATIQNDWRKRTHR